MSTPATTTTAQLREAFAEFEDAAQELTQFYCALEAQVERLTAELAAARADEARQLAEKERLAARLASLLEALPAGVVVLDNHGAIEEFNPAATELLGPIARGDAWSTIVARAFAPQWDDGHDVSLADGRRVNLATQALPGEPGQILLLKDVTETRRLQDQLAHHKRLSAKTELAAAMAHQIRTPLAAALLNTGNVRRGRTEAERERAIDHALKSLRKLERLVDEMLLYARGGRLAVERISATDLLAAIDAAARDTFAPAGFAVEIAPAPEHVDVHANLDALTSVSLNLIENACHACHGSGTLRITCRATADTLALAFEDDGPGVGPQEAASIFEPFYSTRPNGTGLGLSVARAVARAHAGDLVLTPGTRGGACFVLTLPRLAPAVTPEAIAAGARVLRRAG
jgi:two-component system sensor histidine kinase FlrB